MIKQPAFFTTAIHKTEGDHLNLKLAELFGRGKTVFSFEVFPPKRNDSIETIYKTLDRLRFLDPDFISVTYGASGSLADNSTCSLFGISGDISAQVIGVGFIVAVIQDSCETMRSGKVNRAI